MSISKVLELAFTSGKRGRKVGVVTSVGRKVGGRYRCMVQMYGTDVWYRGRVQW